MEEMNQPQNNNQIPQANYPVHTSSKRPISKVWFVSCSIIFILLTCVCIFGVMFSGVLNEMSSITNYSSKDYSNVTESTVLTKKIGNGNSKGSKIAVIEIANTVEFATQSDTSMLGTNNKTIINQLDKASEDNNVKAIVLRFNTPGGAVSAAEPICERIKEIDTQKPVYSFIDAQGTSLGYLLPNCTRYIFSRPDAITGSIGVRADLMDLTGILTNLGAKTQTITNTEGTSKTQDGLFDSTSDEYKAYQSILDEIYEYFIKTVWEGRVGKNNILTEQKLRTYADGRIFSGNQAKNLGLVDELGEYEEVLDRVIAMNQEKFNNSEVEISEYTLYVDPWASLFGAVNEFTTLLTSDKHNRSKLELMMISDN